MKKGFWVILNIYKGRVGMLWEVYDSYAGDADYGYVPCWTGNRKTSSEMKWYNKVEYEEGVGFSFTVPFFIGYILMFIPTVISNIKDKIREKRMPCNPFEEI